MAPALAGALGARRAAAAVAGRGGGAAARGLFPRRQALYATRRRRQRRGPGHRDDEGRGAARRHRDRKFRGPRIAAGPSGASSRTSGHRARPRRDGGAAAVDRLRRPLPRESDGPGQPRAIFGLGPGPIDRAAAGHDLRLFRGRIFARQPPGDRYRQLPQTRRLPGYGCARRRRSRALRPARRVRAPFGARQQALARHRRRRRPVRRAQPGLVAGAK